MTVGKKINTLSINNSIDEKRRPFINRAPNGELDAGTREEIEKQGLELLGVVPQDDTVYRFDCDGRPMAELPADSPVRRALGEIVRKLKL